LAGHVGPPVWPQLGSADPSQLASTDPTRAPSRAADDRTLFMYTNRPPSMTAKSMTRKIGRTRANSTSA
jgi:hypothetical protein